MIILVIIPSIDCTSAFLFCFFALRKILFSSEFCTFARMTLCLATHPYVTAGGVQKSKSVFALKSRRAYQKTRCFLSSVISEKKEETQIVLFIKSQSETCCYFIYSE